MSSRGYRGRGRGRFQSGPARDPLREGLSETQIDSIAATATAPPQTDKVEATNVMPLGSYNWANHTTPTIIIPGGPPVWKEPDMPMQLEPDSGNSFIDQNAARLPLNPLEPMLRAIEITQKGLGTNFSLKAENIDIVTDRNNLRKLMRFVTSNGPNRDPRPGSNRGFRIDLQLAPNDRTLILTRRDEKVIDDSTRFKGYGHNFEKATTEKGSPVLATNESRTHISRLDSTGHHRITRYDLLGLRFLVRYEVDAACSLSTPPHDESNSDTDELDILSKAFAGTSLSETKPNAKPRVAPKRAQMITGIPGSHLHHVNDGELVPQGRVLELRTIRSVFPVPWTDLYPQLFLSQTPAVKLAKQLNGRIDAIQTYTNSGREMREAHTKLAPDFATLVSVLREIRDIALKHKSVGWPLALVWSGEGNLKVHALHNHTHLLSEKDLGLF